MAANSKSIPAMGFTLIELLIVIAIISTLAAILFPVFSQAKASSETAVCLSNMRQLATAFSIYINDFDGIYPPPYGNRYPNSAWVLSGNGPLVGTTSPPCPNGSDTGDPCYIADPTRGSLWPYTMSEKVYKCPTMETKYDPNTGLTVTTASQRITTSMNANFETAKIELVNGGTGRLAVSESQISFPSATFMLVDEDITTRNDGQFSPGNGNIDVFGKQHRNGANLVNADTSGRWYSDSTIQATNPIWRHFKVIRTEE